MPAPLPTCSISSPTSIIVKLMIDTTSTAVFLLESDDSRCTKIDFVSASSPIPTTEITQNPIIALRSDSSRTVAPWSLHSE